MKRIAAVIMLCMLLVCCAGPSESQDTLPPGMQESSRQEETSAQSESDSSESAQQAPTQQKVFAMTKPILVTSLGQNTSALLVREMFTDLNIDFTCELMAAPEMVSDYNTVVLAVGASSKALGANGIGITEEYNRSKKFLEAIPADTTVVMIRIGDSRDKDEWTDKFVSLALPYSDVIITTESSDKDNELSGYADKNGIKYYSSKTVRDMHQLLGELA